MKKGNRLLAFLLSAMLAVGTVQVPVIAGEAAGEFVTAETEETMDDIGENDNGTTGETAGEEFATVMQDSDEDIEAVTEEESSDESEVAASDGSNMRVGNYSEAEGDTGSESDTQGNTGSAGSADSRESTGGIIENSSDDGPETVPEETAEKVFTPESDKPEETSPQDMHDDSSMEEENEAEFIATPSQNASNGETSAYTVVFDANGGYFPEDVVSSELWEKGSSKDRITYKTEYGGSIVPEIRNQDESLNFVGWSYSKNGAIDFVAYGSEDKLWMANVKMDELKSKNCTLYAVWSRDILLTSYGIPYDGSIKITIYADGLLSITGTGTYTGAVYKSGGNLINSLYTIKKVEFGEGITELATWAFRGYESLTKVSLPDGLKTIGSGAFYGCSSLTDITIPNGVTTIKDSAFRNCNSLKSITIPDSVTSIGFDVFDSCTSLEGVVIPYGVTSIGNFTFSNCSSLKSITIPDSVTVIGAEAFSDCTSLKNITIPNSVSTILSSAFENCTSLTSITLPDSLTEIGGWVFEGCTSLKSIVIPDGVTSIGISAFGSCSGLTSITIPDSVTNIENFAFAGCKNLADVYYGGTRTQWDQMEIEIGNYKLLNATIHYNGEVTQQIGEAAVSAISAKTYTGKPFTPAPTVTIGSTTLTSGVDYTVSYVNNTNAGTATVTITGKGSYTGTKNVTFKINKANQSITAKSTASSINVGKTATVSISGAKGKKSFKSSDPSIATVNAATGVVTGKKAGTVTITATSAATANYNAASKTVKITVTAALPKPGNCRFSKWNNAKYNSCQIAWNKVAGADGYQTVLSWTDGSHASTKNLKSNVLKQDCSVAVNHVSQFKVRAYVNTSSGKVYSPWSNVAYITPSPTTLKYKNTGTSSNPKASISWNIIYGCNGYNVFLTTNPNGTWYWNQSTSTKASATSATITKYRGAKLKKGTRYYVRIVTRRKRNGVFCTVPLPAKNTSIGSFVVK